MKKLLSIVLIADFFVLISSFIITAVLKFNFALVYNFIVLLMFLISIFITAFAIALMLIIVVLVSTRTMQSIVTTIFTILFVGGAFLVVAFVPALFGQNYQVIILSVPGLGVCFGIMLGSLTLTILAILLTIRIFRWDS